MPCSYQASARWLAALTALLFAGMAIAADELVPIEARRLRVDTRSERGFAFRARAQRTIDPGTIDPRRGGARIKLTFTGGADEGSTGWIELGSEGWDRRKRGFRYRDPEGTRAGIKRLRVRPGRLTVRGRGDAFPFPPAGGHDSVSVVVAIYDGASSLTWCAELGSSLGAVVRANDSDRFIAKKAPAPLGCPTPTCGDGVVEPGEACDDGNTRVGDGCSDLCEEEPCQEPVFGSTFEGIQAVIFDSAVYDCTNDVCHGGQRSGELDLRATASYDQLFGTLATATEALRVEPLFPETSFLYEKLAAKVEGRSTIGTPMPSGPPDRVLSAPHLRAVEAWIAAGAPELGVVPGTLEDLAVCTQP